MGARGWRRDGPSGRAGGTIAALLGAGAAVVLLVVLLRGGGTGVAVVTAPPRDDVVAVLLPGGPPAFLHADADGVRVVEALTPTGGPVGGVAGWCAPADRHVDVHLGVAFDELGRRITGVQPGRLPRAEGVDAPTGLATWAVEAPRGDDPPAAGAPLRLRDREDPPTEVVRPRLVGEAGYGPPRACRLPDRREGVVDPSSIDGVVDHSHLAAPLDRDRDGWQVADAHLRVGGGDVRGESAAARLCAGPARRTGACEPVGAPLALDVPADAHGGVATAVGGPLAVRLDGGRVVAVAALPRSTWVGGSLRGTATLRLLLDGRDASGWRLAVRGEGPCLLPGPARRTRGPALLVVDRDTLYEDLPTTIPPVDDEGPAGRAVDVVVDLVTCRALAVRGAG